MRFRDKGFTLVELLVAVTMVAILISVAVPSFITMITKTEADNEISELYRSLNYARSEAINQGVAIRVVPQTTNLWTGLLNVQIGSTATGTSVLRVLPAMSTSAVVNVSSSAGATSYIEFNNLGALNFPLAAVAVGYTRGTQTRSMGICLNGRVISGGTCP